MKKLLTVFALAVTCIIALHTQKAFATYNKPDETPNNKVVAAMHHDFPSAVKVTWSQNEKECVAIFHSEAGSITATYNKKGKLLSTLINSDAKHVPFIIQTEMNKKYPGFVPQSMTEYISSKEHSYYILLKNQTGNEVKWMRVKCNGTGDIQVLQKLQQTV